MPQRSLLLKKAGDEFLYNFKFCYVPFLIKGQLLCAVYYTSLLDSEQFFTLSLDRLLFYIKSICHHQHMPFVRILNNVFMCVYLLLNQLLQMLTERAYIILLYALDLHSLICAKIHLILWKIFLCIKTGQTKMGLTKMNLQKCLCSFSINF